MIILIAWNIEAWTIWVHRWQNLVFRVNYYFNGVCTWEDLKQHSTVSSLNKWTRLKYLLSRDWACLKNREWWEVLSWFRGKRNETAAAAVRSEIEMYYVCLNIKVQVLLVYIWVHDWFQSVLISQVLTAEAQMKRTVRVSMTDAFIKETIIADISPPHKRSHILKTPFRHKIIPLTNTFQLIYLNIL